jgi:Protein of unknown function (DUF664)
VPDQAAPAHQPSLLGSLAWTRAHVLEAIEGLPEDTLNHAYVASGWTPLDLVRHLTIDVERYWFRAVMAAEPDAVAFAAGESSGWRLRTPEAYADVVAAYREETAYADRIIAALAPDAVPRWEQGADGRTDLTAVILHVLVDTATHAGHLDIVREGIDRKQFLIVHP